MDRSKSKTATLAGELSAWGCQITHFLQKNMIFQRFFPKHASGMRGSDIDMIENRSRRSRLPPLGQWCLGQPSRKFGTYLSKPIVSSRRDAKFCISSRRDAIFWAGPEFPRKMRPRNILGQILTKHCQQYLIFSNLVCHFSRVRVVLGKKENDRFPKHMAYIS